jgi:sortase A
MNYRILSGSEKPGRDKGQNFKNEVIMKKQNIVSAKSIILVFSLSLSFAAVALADGPVPGAAPSGQGKTLTLPSSLPDQPAKRIVIPAINVDTPVVLTPVRNGTWDMEQITHQVAHLQGTANPGDSNNVVLGGHYTLPDRSPGPFAELGNLEMGDQVLVYSDDGKVYVYKVGSMKAVEVIAVEVASPTSDPTLTLITCHNWDPGEGIYQDRLVVVAHLSRWKYQ